MQKNTLTDNILFVFGTRPEAIKLAPVINLFKKNKLNVKVCVTAQHREMLDQVLDFFKIIPDYDLNIMQPGQDLYDLTTRILVGLKAILKQEDFHYVFVHGDTTTTFAASLAAYYSKIKLCHVEAGLRTFNKYSPFPEEMNRHLTSRIADFHFCPTETSKNNLLKEGVDLSQIFITGNTVVDSLFESIKLIKNSEFPEFDDLFLLNKKIILVTGHRRENFGEGFLNICEAIKKVALKFEDALIVFPVHLNPNVQIPVYQILSGIDNIKLIKPLSYQSFVYLMNNSYLILTDSGGVQEEAPSLGKPVLVMRENTERPEAVIAGTVKLVGTSIEKIYKAVESLLLNQNEYNEISFKLNPYGDGHASEKIFNIIINDLKNDK